LDEELGGGLEVEPGFGSKNDEARSGLVMVRVSGGEVRYLPEESSGRGCLCNVGNRT